MADDKSVPGDLLAPASDAPPPSRRDIVPGLSDRRHAGIRRRACRSPAACWSSSAAGSASANSSKCCRCRSSCPVRTSSTSRSSSAAASAAPSGSVAAALGLMLMPFLIVLALAALYAQFRRDRGRARRDQRRVRGGDRAGDRDGHQDGAAAARASPGRSRWARWRSSRSGCCAFRCCGRWRCSRRCRSPSPGGRGDEPAAAGRPRAAVRRCCRFWPSAGSMR